MHRGFDFPAEIHWRLLQNVAYTLSITSSAGISPRKSLEEATMGAEGSKRMIVGSLAAAGVVALLSLLDLVLGIPFAGYSSMMDILFIVAAAMIAYLAWDAYKDLR